MDLSPSIEMVKRRHYTPVEIVILLFFSILLLFADSKIRFRSTDVILKSLGRRRPHSKLNKPFPRRLSLERIVLLVELADRRFRRESSCLRRVIVLNWVLTAFGQASEIELRVGVNLKEKNKFEAHTWLEYRGAALESPLASSFQPLRKTEAP